MTKRLFTSLLALVVSVHVSGCSSSGSHEDGDVAQSNDNAFSEEGEGDFAEEAASSDGLEQETVSDEGVEGEELALDDTAGGDDIDAEVAAAEKPAPTDLAGGGDEFGLEEPEPLPEEVASEPAAPVTDVAAAPIDQPSSAPIEEPLFSHEGSALPEAAPPIEDMSIADIGEPPPLSNEPPMASAMRETSPYVGDSMASSMGAVEPPAPSFVPVKKIKDSAFTAGGANINRVYIARPGDTVKSIGQKIYGQNRRRDLLAWNPHLHRGVKTGDKIYYTSPTNPADPQMLTYYEDIGASAQTYVTRDGENIRRLSKDLLGSSESWKEVWATNMNVESKGDLPAGTELRYWTDGPAAPTPVTPIAQAAPQQPSAPAPGAPDQFDSVMPDFESESLDAASTAAPPPVPQDMAQGPGQAPEMQSPSMDLPPMDDMGQAAPPTDLAQNDQGIAPPPPPPQESSASAGTTGLPDDVPPPPAPNEPRPIAKKPPTADIASSDPGTQMMMGLSVILLGSSALLVFFIKKNRAKRIDLTQTQI